MPETVIFKLKEGLVLNFSGASLTVRDEEIGSLKVIFIFSKLEHMSMTCWTTPKMTCLPQSHLNL